MRHWSYTVLEGAFRLKGSPPAHVREGLERLVKLASAGKYHVFRTAELEGLAEELSKTVSLLKLSQVMCRVAVSCGFQNFVVFLLHQPSGVTFRTRICTSFKESWIAQYQKESYQVIDPVVARASSEDGYFQFSDLESESLVLENFWQDADTHGVGRNGICYALTHSSGMRIGISFCTTKPANQVREIFELNGSDLSALCQLVADRFALLNAGPPLPEKVLTKDELRFLQTLASSPDPKAALAVNPKFGSNKNMQSSIRQKIGVQSTFQAVALAASKGWLSLPTHHRAEEKNPSFLMSEFMTSKSLPCPATWRTSGQERKNRNSVNVKPQSSQEIRSSEGVRR